MTNHFRPLKSVSLICHSSPLLQNAASSSSGSRIFISQEDQTDVLLTVAPEASTAKTDCKQFRRISGEAVKTITNLFRNKT